MATFEEHHVALLLEHRALKEKYEALKRKYDTKKENAAKRKKGEGEEEEEAPPLDVKAKAPPKCGICKQLVKGNDHTKCREERAARKAAK